MIKFFFQIFTIVLCLFILTIEARDTESSEPYISGDTFRAHCDFIFDETRQSLNPYKVKNGNTIFVKTDFLPAFFSKIHPRIKEKYILITHNSDFSMTEKYSKFLEDDKIIAWFAQNVENYSHLKLHPLPIGLANKYWSHGNVNLINEMMQIAPNLEKKILLYMNFLIATRVNERSMVADMFREEPYCVIESPKEYGAYLTDLAQSKFVLSPRGNGLDCHRTWESLLMGAIPIVKTSSLDPMYEDLPVLIVGDWNEINDEFLLKKYEEMSLNDYNTEKKYFEYWLNLIKSYKF